VDFEADQGITGLPLNIQSISMFIAESQQWYQSKHIIGSYRYRASAAGALPG